MNRPENRFSSVPRKKLLRPRIRRLSEDVTDPTRELRRLCRAGEVDQVVGLAQGTWQARIAMAVGRHRRAFYAALEMVYEFDLAVATMEDDAQRGVLKGLELKPGGNRSLALLKHFWPPPRGEGRKAEQNNLSRYAKVLNAAKEKGIRHDQLADVLSREGGIDGFLGPRRHRRPDQAEIPSLGPPKALPGRQKAPSARIRGSFRREPGGRVCRLRVAKALRKQLPLAKGKLIAIHEADSAGGLVSMVAYQTLHLSTFIEDSDLLDEIVRFTASLKR